MAVTALITFPLIAEDHVAGVANRRRPSLTPHRKKSHGVRSDDRGGQLRKERTVALARSIQRRGRVSNGFIITEFVLFELNVSTFYKS
jgi:hypothetical protein